MADFTALSDEAIQRKAEVYMQKRRAIIGVGDEGVPDTVVDSDWVRQTLRAGSLDYENKKDDMLRFWTSADTKFEDTTLGGNYVVNPRPQFTRYADTRSMGIAGDTQKVAVNRFSNRLGMGLYYAEAIDDTHQTIHMIFGQAEFNSLGNYFTNFFNLDASRLANGGRWSQAIADFFKKGTTLFLGIIFWPLTLTLYGLSKVEEILQFLMRKPASKYYYMRSNMYLYWSTVSSIVNRIAAVSGMTRFASDGNIFSKIGAVASGGGSAGEAAENDIVDQDYKALLSAHFSDMFNKDGYINIARVVNRAQRLRNALNDKMDQAIKSGEPGFKTFVNTLMRDRVDSSRGLGGWSLAQAAEAYYTDAAQQFQDRFSSGIGTWNGADEEAAGTSKITPLETTIQSVSVNDGKDVKSVSYLDRVLSSFHSEWRDGSAFATFRVDHTGSVDESFSSSTGETDLSSSFNGTSAQARSAKFSLAGGNFSDGVAGKIMGGVLSAAIGVVEGAMSYLGIDGILAPGNAYADIPQYWQNSSANLPRMSYSIDLVSPYGDPLSRMMNIYIPLAMLLAAALPLATGKQSYTSPFLCQVFDQGRAITRLGIVDSLQITRGTSNLAFNKNKEFMSVNVAFTVKDLSSICSMPVATGFSLDPLKGIFDEDTTFTDYIGVLSSLSLGKSHYLSEKIAINTLNKWRSLQDATNVDRLISWMHDRTPLGWADMVMKNTERY